MHCYVALVMYSNNIKCVSAFYSLSMKIKGKPKVSIGY